MTGLLLLAAALTSVFGFASRAFIGRRRNSKAVRGLVRTIVVACGLCLTAIFLLGYETLA
jgi:hypothetical protein